MASTWAGTANNETVSKNALNNAIGNAIFYQRAAFTPSTEQTTKSEAAAWVFLDESYAPFAAKSSNQLVVKADLKPIFQYSGGFYYNIDFKGWFGWNNSINACANYAAANTTTVNWNGTLAVGTVVYIPNGTLDLATVPYYVIVYSGTPYWITFSDGVYNPVTMTYGYTITTIGTCIFCTEYINNNGTDANGVNYTDCNGTVYTNQTIAPNQTICVQDGTLFGGDSGFLTSLGACF